MNIVLDILSDCAVCGGGLSSQAPSMLSRSGSWSAGSVGWMVIGVQLPFNKFPCLLTTWRRNAW